MNSSENTKIELVVLPEKGTAASDNAFKKCQDCRGCCYFPEEEQYFAPIFTKEEIETIAKTRKEMPTFKPFRDSANVFKIDIIPSTRKSGQYVCPFLDEKTHLCGVYGVRPFDCKIWPFMFMKDKNGKTVLASFTKDACPITDSFSEKEYDEYKKSILDFINKENGFALLKSHPDLASDYEEETYIIFDADEVARFQNE